MIYIDRYVRESASAGRALAALGMTWGVTEEIICSSLARGSLWNSPWLF